MKHSILVLIFLSICFSGCHKEGTETQNEDGYQKMNLEDLQVGQKFYYKLAKGDYYRNDSRWQYTNDTLEVEVMDKIGDKYLVSERIKSGSDMFQAEEDYYFKDKEERSNFWQVQNDTLKIMKPEDEDYVLSHLISYPQDALPFDAGSDAREVKDLGWVTDYGYTETDNNAVLPVLVLFDRAYSDLTVAIRNSPMALDSPGSTYIYNKNDGIVRTSVYSYWVRQGVGWHRLR